MEKKVNQENTQKLGIFGATKSERKPDFVGIEKEAKQILDKFAKALESIDEEKLDFYVEREDFERIEIASLSSLEDKDSKFADKPDIVENFKQRILENAPNHDEDFIIAEKGGWKK